MIRASQIRRALGAVALLAASALTPSLAQAQAPLSFGSWQTFTWLLADGTTPAPVHGSGYTFTSMLQTRIRITDGGYAGDAFAIFVNGSPFDITPSVSYDGVEVANGDEAWGTPGYSQLEFLLDPGQYTITIAVREDAGFGSGEGFIRADQITGQSVVPEPATLLLTGSGLASLLALAARRRRAAGASPTTDVG